MCWDWIMVIDFGVVTLVAGAALFGWWYAIRGWQQAMELNRLVFEALERAHMVIRTRSNDD